jgi:hypothetical protein
MQAFPGGGMQEEIHADSIVAFHDAALQTVHWAKVIPPRHHSGIWKYVELNHRFNSLLWDEEDLARRRNVPDSEIASNKRAIDTFNQKRNDAVERLDETLLLQLGAVTLQPGARLNSETAGAMCDRLSILALKIHAMRLQTQRKDVDAEHIANCNAKLGQLEAQRRDLAACLRRLLVEASAGTAYFRIYRQFKMYNDPKLNPQLYQKK